MSRSISQIRKDAWRRPEQVLRWIDVQPGETVGDVAGANGYWAHFFGKAVGSTGEVFVHNASEWKGFFDHYGVMEKVEPAGDHVTYHWSRMEDPFPNMKGKLDVIFDYATYHDMYDMPVHRGRFLANVKMALKPGGKLVVIDHHAVKGSGCKHSGSNSGLHRVEKGLVLKEILAAGFTLEEDSDLLRCNSDDLEKGAWRSPQVATDRFALMFRK